MPTPAPTRDQVIERLRTAAVSPSAPRIAIYAFLAANPIHPTVDTIFHNLSPAYPTLSRTTVYNTLKLFADKNLLQVVTIEDGELRFDANTRFHAHGKCRRCGRIWDLPEIPCPDFPVSDSFTADSAQLHFYGLCTACQ